MRVEYVNCQGVFMLFSALNHHGYDLEGNKEMHPVRLWAREQLKGAPRRDYFRHALPGWPRVNWLATTMFCLDEAGGWKTEPETIWSEMAWESPQPIDEEARTWLRQLPEMLKWWEQNSPALDLWDEYQHRMDAAQEKNIKEQIAAQVRDKLEGTVFAKTGVITVFPNYLQSDWSTDPVPWTEGSAMLVGPLSLRTVGSIMHEVVHEYFQPLLYPMRNELGRYIRFFETDRPALEKWGYWNPDPNITVYKVAQECAVRAATALLNGEEPDPDWPKWGLTRALDFYKHFRKSWSRF